MWHKPLHYFSVSLFFQTSKETLPSMLCTVRKLQYMTGWMLKSIIPKILTIGLKLLKQTNKKKNRFTCGVVFTRNAQRYYVTSWSDFNTDFQK